MLVNKHSIAAQHRHRIDRGSALCWKRRRDFGDRHLIAIVEIASCNHRNSERAEIPGHLHFHCRRSIRTVPPDTILQIAPPSGTKATPAAASIPGAALSRSTSARLYFRRASRSGDARGKSTVATSTPFSRNPKSTVVNLRKLPTSKNAPKHQHQRQCDLGRGQSLPQDLAAARMSRH
jgi:hypothetical protein